MPRPSVSAEKAKLFSLFSSRSYLGPLSSANRMEEVSITDSDLDEIVTPSPSPSPAAGKGGAFPLPLWFAKPPRDMDDTTLSEQGWERIEECPRHQGKECWEHPSLVCPTKKKSSSTPSPSPPHFPRPKAFGRLHGAGVVVERCHDCPARLGVGVGVGVARSKSVSVSCGSGCDRLYLDRKGRYRRRSSALILLDEKQDSDSEDEDDGVETQIHADNVEAEENDYHSDQVPLRRAYRRESLRPRFDNDLALSQARRASLRSRTSTDNKTSYAQARATTSRPLPSRMSRPKHSLWETPLDESESDSDFEYNEKRTWRPAWSQRRPRRAAVPVARRSTTTPPSSDTESDSDLASSSEEEVRASQSQSRKRQRRIVMETSDEDENDCGNQDTPGSCIVVQLSGADDFDLDSTDPEAALSKALEKPVVAVVKSTALSVGVGETSHAASQDPPSGIKIYEASVDHWSTSKPLQALAPTLPTTTPQRLPALQRPTGIELQDEIQKPSSGGFDQAAQMGDIQARLSAAISRAEAAESGAKTLQKENAKLKELADRKDEMISILTADNKFAAAANERRDEEVQRLRDEATRLGDKSALVILPTSCPPRSEKKSQIADHELSVESSRSLDETAIGPTEGRPRKVLTSDPPAFIRVEEERDAALLVLSKVMMERTTLLQRVMEAEARLDQIRRMIGEPTALAGAKRRVGIGCALPLEPESEDTHRERAKSEIVEGKRETGTSWQKGSKRDGILEAQVHYETPSTSRDEELERVKLKDEGEGELRPEKRLKQDVEDNRDEERRASGWGRGAVSGWMMGGVPLHPIL